MQFKIINARYIKRQFDAFKIDLRLAIQSIIPLKQNKTLNARFVFGIACGDKIKKKLFFF